MTTKSATERVAAIRDEYARLGENVDHLSDLELLSEHVEQRDRERIDINDRYMRLLTEQRKYGERVRAAAISGMRSRIDVLATQAVSGKANELTRILGAIDVLPERANADRVALLKQMAADTRHMLRLIDETAADNPVTAWRLDDNRALVHAARSVVGVLRDKPGVSTDDALRLVGEALKSNGNLHDLFDVANATPIVRQQPAFAGADWTEMAGGSYWAFEPDGSRYRVIAYSQDDVWFLDLQGPTGALLATGETSETEVAETASALIGQAPVLAKSGLRPWQCWERTVHDLQNSTAAQAA